MPRANSAVLYTLKAVDLPFPVYRIPNQNEWTEEVSFDLTIQNRQKAMLSKFLKSNSDSFKKFDAQTTSNLTEKTLKLRF